MLNKNTVKNIIIGAFVVMFTACGGGGGGSPTDAGSSTSGGTTGGGQVGHFKVKKTGITKSYGKHSIEATDGSIRDDGFYKSGVAPKYSRDNDTEVVTDHVTGLQWIDPKKVVKKYWVTKENFYKKNYTDTSGDTAVNYCPNLSFGGHSDWRLPTARELTSVMTYRRKSNFIINDAFKYGNDTSHWTSTLLAEELSESFGDLFVVLRIWSVRAGEVNKATVRTDHITRGSDLIVRCVRNSIAPANFSKSEDIVTDNITKLQWQNDASMSNNQGDFNWFQAIEYCEDLALGGHEDWRLPNINELTSIADFTRFPVINKIFAHGGKDQSLTRWSSSASDSEAMILNFRSGNYSRSSKLNSIEIRCVRAGL
jgi:hypothetical protein